jgi:phage host-nuclease inhibitor protein Gam
MTAQNPPVFESVADPAKLTRDEIESRLGEMAARKAEHTQLAARLARAKARLAKTMEVRLQTIAGEISDAEKLIRAWAEANRKKEFGELKTLKLLHGELQFKAGGPAVVLLKNWTDKLCLASLKKFRVLKLLYIRTKEELNRSQILADFRAEKIDNDRLAKFGCEVTQSEFFSINLNPPAA